MWGWFKLTYDDGFEMVVESGEWGESAGLTSVRPSADDLKPQDKKKLDAMPDPKPCVGFGEAVKTRQKAGGNAEAAHRTACIMHLANVAIRTGRTIHFDPVKEVVIGDEEANRLVHPPMRATEVPIFITSTPSDVISPGLRTREISTTTTPGGGSVAVGAGVGTFRVGTGV